MRLAIILDSDGDTADVYELPAGPLPAEMTAAPVGEFPFSGQMFSAMIGLPPTTGQTPR